MDQIDYSILTELQENARISNVDLADRVGLSPSACLRRVSQLEKAGVIVLDTPSLVGEAMREAMA